jgi:hypothetical protein
LLLSRGIGVWYDPLSAGKEDQDVERGHSEEQILRALLQAEGGTRASDICASTASCRVSRLLPFTRNGNLS